MSPTEELLKIASAAFSGGLPSNEKAFDLSNTGDDDDLAAFIVRFLWSATSDYEDRDEAFTEAQIALSRASMRLIFVLNAINNSR